MGSFIRQVLSRAASFPCYTNICLPRERKASVYCKVYLKRWFPIYHSAIGEITTFTFFFFLLFRFWNGFRIWRALLRLLQVPGGPCNTAFYLCHSEERLRWLKCRQGNTILDTLYARHLESCKDLKGGSPIKKSHPSGLTGLRCFWPIWKLPDSLEWDECKLHQDSFILVPALNSTLCPALDFLDRGNGLGRRYRVFLPHFSSLSRLRVLPQKSPSPTASTSFLWWAESGQFFQDDISLVTSLKKSSSSCETIASLGTGDKKPVGNGQAIGQFISFWKTRCQENPLTEIGTKRASGC